MNLATVGKIAAPKFSTLQVLKDALTAVHGGRSAMASVHLPSA